MSHSTAKRLNKYTPPQFEEELTENPEKMQHILIYTNPTSGQMKDLDKKLAEVPLDETSERDKISRNYLGGILSPATSYCREEQIKFSETIGIKTTHLDIPRITGQQISDFPQKRYILTKAGLSEK